MAALQNLLAVCFLALVASTQESLAFVTNRAVGLIDESSIPHAFVTLGASGDLAKRKIYPALWQLYRNNLLPPNVKFYGYARSRMTVSDLREQVAPFVKVKPEDEKLYDEFWSLHSYVGGSKDSDADYAQINTLIGSIEENGRSNRIFYLALPPSVFSSAGALIKKHCMPKNGATRVVIEKPFGRDSESSQQLSNQLSALFTEDQIYRMDHFLGKEMVQNILTLRFANQILSPSWNKDNIAAIEVLFEESIGVEGRGWYFDSYGIIRDVMQNHLLQVLSLIAMEKPASGHPNDVRDAKVNLLKNTRSIVLNDVVLGQYVGNPESSDPNERIGYREDPSVPKDSLTPTFALTVLRVDNERWNGVPFIIRAGKGLGEKKTQVRVQYKNVTDDINNGHAQRNEVIFKIAKGEAVQMKLTSKTPGITSDIEPINIDFTYNKEYKNLELPEAYERLLLEVFQGSQLNFVRTDELSEAWRIFTPVLHEIENKKVRPIDYKFGSSGPVEADNLEKENDLL